jgi:hypothetical protein
MQEEDETARRGRQGSKVGGGGAPQAEKRIPFSGNGSSLIPTEPRMQEESKGQPTWLDRVKEQAETERAQQAEPVWEPERTSRPRGWDGEGMDSPFATFDLDGQADAGPTMAPIAGEKHLAADAPHPARLPEAEGRGLEENVGLSVEQLRAAALQMARRDAQAGLPVQDAEGLSESERELRDRCAALFGNWQGRERSRLNDLVSETESKVTRTLGGIALDVDRFERITSELYRLKKRWEASRSMVQAALDEQSKEEEEEEQDGSRSFKTRWYALAIGFLGLVEFLANAPVFGALLPRDPLTEQQLRFVSETSEGWLAGGMRVVSQFILRPDAALLAAGVVTFLCVLAHFFGHSLRSLLVTNSTSRAGETVGQRSPLEFVVPMILSGIGLALVLGVLFEARVTLGEVSSQRFAQDSVKIEELRRTASWLRVDGNLVAANEQANRADDMEALATEQREYAASMSGLSFPILLLNTTLVLVALTAAYFHQRDRRRDRFNERPYEAQRRTLVEMGDAAQERVTDAMGSVVRHVRDLKSLLGERPLKEAPALAHQLEATLAAYRAENGRLRELDPRQIAAFREPVSLTLEVAEEETRELLMRAPGDYEAERQRLAERFEDTRANFTGEATAW